MSRHPLMYVLTATLLASAPLGCAYDTDEGEPELIDTEYAGGIDPIIFVHGCTPPDATDELAAFLFEPMKDYFRSKGYPESYLVSFVNQGPQCQTNAAFASQLSTLVSQVRAATGAARVDVVAHSMGSLATRLYIKQGGNKYVRDFVGIGGTNHGTDGGVLGTDGLFIQDFFGGYPWFEGFQEMFPPYACAGETWEGSADVQAAVNGCLTPSGRTVFVDETPNGGVDYLSIRNTLDEIVSPVESACLNQRFQNDCSDSRVNTAVTVPAGECFFDPSVPCEAHLRMLWDPGVIGKTYAFVAHADDGNDTSAAGATGATDDDSD